MKNQGKQQFFRQWYEHPIVKQYMSHCYTSPILSKFDVINEVCKQYQLNNSTSNWMKKYYQLKAQAYHVKYVEFKVGRWG